VSSILMNSGLVHF